MADEEAEAPPPENSPEAAEPAVVEVAAAEVPAVEAPAAEAPPAEAPPAEAPAAEAPVAETPAAEASVAASAPAEVADAKPSGEEGEVTIKSEKDKTYDTGEEEGSGECLTEATSTVSEKKKVEAKKTELAKDKSKKKQDEKEAKPKKGKVEKQDGETQTGKAKKGKSKKKDFQQEKPQVQIQVPTGGEETEDLTERLPEEGAPPSTPKGKKGKGGKGKKKDKKGKKGIKRKGQSFSEFLEYRASQQMESDEWTWESYSVSEDVPVEPEVKGKKGKKGKGKGKGKKGKKAKKGASDTAEDGGGEKPEKPKKEKKGKKGKKGKKEDKAAEEPQAPAEVDIFAEINKMKALAEAQTAGGDAVDEAVQATPKKKKAKKKKEKGEPKEKKPKGPKLTKKQKAALAAEMAKIAEKEAEIAAKKAAEEERIRLIEERKANIEKEKREIREQLLRIEQLNNSAAAINHVKERCVQKRIEEKEEREWEQYLLCDGLPDPNVCGEMNTYLHLWDKVMEATTLDDAAARTNEALHLLSVLTNLIDDPEFVDPDVLSNWKWLNGMFCEYQQRSLDAATYTLLRNIENNLNRLDLFTADYRRQEEQFIINFWLLISMPPSLPNPKKSESPRVYLDFPEIDMNVVFPTNIDCKLMAIRAMYLKYDHLSRESATFDDPPAPEQYNEDLNQVTAVEWRKKLFYKYEEKRKNQKAIPLSELAEEDRLKEIDINDIEEDIPSVPYQKLEPTASEFVISEEDQIFMSLREGMVMEVEEHVINLRRFTILGGVYFLNLYYQPPQPKDMVTFVMTITRLEAPPHLSKVPFHKTIENLPLKVVEGEEEEEEEEFEEATQEEIDEFREAELNRLILIKFKIPTHVLLFQPPILCQWHHIKKVWSTVDIHEFEYDEEEKMITYKSGKFGSFAIATPRYLNFPFRYWEIKANEDATITFALATQILTVTFTVKENLVCISELNFELEDFETDIVDPLIGEYHRLPFLIRIMREIGIEIFPPYDAFCYIEGTCEKYLIIEKFLYEIMGYLGVSYNFVWSRWNFTAGRRNMIMLMREYKPGKPRQPQFSTLMVTPLRANFINCTEESEEFDGTADDATFYSDLFHLMKATSSMFVRSKIQNSSPNTAITLSELLLATRILSMC